MSSLNFYYSWFNVDVGHSLEKLTFFVLGDFSFMNFDRYLTQKIIFQKVFSVLMIFYFHS